ncbi:MAG: DUF6880 family protein [Candidatus Neomarinimicrobiota bacterium]
MSDKRRQKLIDLGAEALADVLINLGNYSDKADDVIDKIISSKTERLKAVKKKISSLKRSKRFIEWKYAADFADDLEIILEEVQACVSNPIEGVKIITSFFETDSSVFQRCDDSSGFIGSVYDNAMDLFVQYASECEDKKLIVDILLKLLLKDEFGVRESLLESVTKFLPRASIRLMITEFRKRADAEDEKYAKEKQFRFIEILARKIKDAKLFEEIRLERSEEISRYSCIEIAEVYFESGNTETAHAWLKKIPEDEVFLKGKKNALLLKIYKKQGNIEKQQEILNYYFVVSPSIHTLNDLLDLVGHDKKDDIIVPKVREILNKHVLDTSDIYFMLDLDKVDEAEAHLIKYHEQLDGDPYYDLLPLAKTMEKEKRYLCACLIYRSLLISILERAFYKAYQYAANYLKTLDKLSQNISDWKGIIDHNSFKEHLVEKHGRKRSFWAKYDN